MGKRQREPAAATSCDGTGGLARRGTADMGPGGVRVLHGFAPARVDCSQHVWLAVLGLFGTG